LQIYKEALNYFEEADRDFSEIIDGVDERSAGSSSNIETESEELSVSDQSKGANAFHLRRKSYGISTLDAFEKQAIVPKPNIAAFCIAAILNSHDKKRLQLNYQENRPIALLEDGIEISEELDGQEMQSISEERTKISDHVMRVYQKAVLNSRKGKIDRSRFSLLEEKGAAVMQQFCVTSESDTPDYASLVSQTLICMSGYLHQRSDDETMLHPHFRNVPHRHCQLFNRAWCRLAELQYDSPFLHFALLQVIPLPELIFQSFESCAGRIVHGHTQQSRSAAQ
jgi:hypothetical protein